MIELGDVGDGISGRAVTGLGNRIINLALACSEHIHVPVGRDCHGRDKVRGQFVLMFDDVSGCRFNRVVVSLVNVDAEGLCSQCVNVSAGAHGVLTDIGPGEVRLNA